MIYGSKKEASSLSKDLPLSEEQFVSRLFTSQLIFNLPIVIENENMISNNMRGDVLNKIRKTEKSYLHSFKIKMSKPRQRLDKLQSLPLKNLNLT